MISTHNRRASIILFVCICMAFLVGCLPFTPQPASNFIQTTLQPTPLPQAEVIFLVQIPENTPQNKTVYFEIVDEITGIPFNSQRYATNRIDDAHVMVHMPLQLGDIVKYRYSLEGLPVQYEHGAAGSVIRYRTVLIPGVNTYVDQVVSWDGKITGEQATGKIFGTIKNALNQQAVADAIISINGVQTVSGANGEFALENLPIGKHRIVIQEINGWYVPFQQEVVIANEAITPVNVLLNPREKVKVTFHLNVPGNMKNLPVRLIGEPYFLGNLLSDQAAGLSVSSARAPFLVCDETGRYHLTLDLPAGMLLRYKYSLGDGFWNAEHTQKGDYRIRQILIPSQDAEIVDSVEQWSIGSNNPVTFKVHVPLNTPATDSVSIQFKPFIWMPPLPMWSLGDGNWIYMLYSPLEWFKEMDYRYCRNDQCDDYLASNPQKIILEREDEKIDDLSQWNDLSLLDAEDDSWMKNPILSRPESFVRGVALSSEYNPSWQPFINNGFQNISEDHANWVVLTPTWTVDDLFHPVIEPIPGSNPLAFDQYQMADWAKINKLHIAVYPQLVYSMKSLEKWLPEETDTGWWERWFNRYQSYLVHSAIVASQSGAEAILLSDPLRNSPDLLSRIPQDFYQIKWLETIQVVREKFQGKIIWAETYKSPTSFPPFVDKLDFIYVSYQGTDKLFEITDIDLEKQINKILDNGILNALEDTGKPVILGLSIPSGSNENPMMPEQAKTYAAFLAAVNSREWIAGVVTEGYHPAIESRAIPTSVRAKPAEDVIKKYYLGFQE